MWKSVLLIFSVFIVSVLAVLRLHSLYARYKRKCRNAIVGTLQLHPNGLTLLEILDRTKLRRTVDKTITRFWYFQLNDLLIELEKQNYIRSEVVLDPKLNTNRRVFIYREPKPPKLRCPSLQVHRSDRFSKRASVTKEDRRNFPT